MSDGLSRRGEDEEATLALISFPIPLWIEELKASYSISQEVVDICTRVQKGETFDKNYTMQQGLLLRKGKLVIVSSSPFKERILQFIHNSPQAGHVGYRKTLHKARVDFY